MHMVDSSGLCLVYVDNSTHFEQAESEDCGSDKVNRHFPNGRFEFLH